MPTVNFPLTITSPLDFTITPAKEGLYAVSIAARCRGANDDLRVEFDGRNFRELPPTGKSSFFDIPPAWNGSRLKGQTQTVIFILWLAPIEYTIKFIPRGTAEIVREPSLLHLPNPRAISFLLNDQASDANGRPWYTLALVDLPLASCGADVSVGWHWRDGDDLKLIVDGRVQPNANSRRYRDWLWSARFLDKFTGPKRETKSVSPALPRGIHYLEFWADRTPTIHTITLDLGTDQRLPSREAPRWTGKFEDDSDDLLMTRVIYGEMGNQPSEAKLGVAWVIRNRAITAEGKQIKTYREVILASSQFSVFKDSTEKVFIRMTNPPLANQIERQAWNDSRRVMEGAISGALPDPTQGAKNFFSIRPLDPAWRPDWADEKKFVVQFGQTRFYKL